MLPGHSVGRAVQCDCRATRKVLRVLKYLFRAPTCAMCPEGLRVGSSTALISSSSCRRFPKVPRRRIENSRVRGYCTHRAQHPRRTSVERFVLCAFSQFTRSCGSKPNRTGNSKRRYHSFCRHFVNMLASYSKKNCHFANAQCLLSAFQNLHEAHRAPIQ